MAVINIVITRFGAGRDCVRARARMSWGAPDHFEARTLVEVEYPQEKDATGEDTLRWALTTMLRAMGDGDHESPIG